MCLQTNSTLLKGLLKQTQIENSGTLYSVHVVESSYKMNRIFLNICILKDTILTVKRAVWLGRESKDCVECRRFESCL